MSSIVRKWVHLPRIPRNALLAASDVLATASHVLVLPCSRRVRPHVRELGVVEWKMTPASSKHSVSRLSTAFGSCEYSGSLSWMISRHRIRSVGWEGTLKIAGVENAEVEIAAPECKARNLGRKSMESEGFKNVFLAILTENRVMILACLAHRVDFECNV